MNHLNFHEPKNKNVYIKRFLFLMKHKKLQTNFFFVKNKLIFFDLSRLQPVNHMFLKENRIEKKYTLGMHYIDISTHTEFYIKKKKLNDEKL